MAALSTGLKSWSPTFDFPATWQSPPLVALGIGNASHSHHWELFVIRRRTELNQ
jgi:hypothetical protein